MGRRRLCDAITSAAEVREATEALRPAEVRGGGDEGEDEGCGEESEEGGLQELEMDEEQVPEEEGNQCLSI